MKKIIAKIVAIALIASMAITGLVGCASSKWSGSVSLKNPGNVVSNGGFIAETDNYIYFINGLAASNGDNAMGKPIKGALMVADKNDPTKSEMVVPKLMVASDYNAGVFIDGGYAYYGTPSVEKDSSGNIANYQLTFMRTKLDGSGETDEFFTLGSISSEYRIVKSPAGVCIYYYDSADKALICYNTSSKTKAVVAKTNDKADGDTLNKYVFINNSDITDVVAYFTATVYLDKYDSVAAQGSGYSRVTAGYNRVYAVKAGNNTPELVIDGVGARNTDTDDITYDIKLIDDGFVFFTQTNKGTATTYALSLEDSYTYTNWTKGTKIVNESYVLNTNLFISLSEVYVLGENKVYKTTLLEKDNTTKTPILEKSKVNKLLFINNEDGADFLYYYNDTSRLAKIDLTKNAVDNNEIRVSESIVSTTWFLPEIVKIGSDKKANVFYCDGSESGKSYIKYVDVNAEIKEEDSDEDGENDLFYLDIEQIKTLGKMATADAVALFEAKITKLADGKPEDGIGLDQEADDEFKAEFEALKAEYDNLPSAVKEGVSSSLVAKFGQYAKAYEVAEKYKELNGIGDCGDAEEAEKAGFKAKYEQVKSYLVAFKNGDDRETIDALIATNLKANYTKAVKFFESK